MLSPDGGMMRAKSYTPEQASDSSWRMEEEVMELAHGHGSTISRKRSARGSDSR